MTEGFVNTLLLRALLDAIEDERRLIPGAREWGVIFAAADRVAADFTNPEEKDSPQNP